MQTTDSKEYEEVSLERGDDIYINRFPLFVFPSPSFSHTRGYKTAVSERGGNIYVTNFHVFIHICVFVLTKEPVFQNSYST